MATHSSILAWSIPGTRELGGLPPPIYGVAQSRTRLKRLSSSSSCCWYISYSQEMPLDLSSNAWQKYPMCNKLNA